MVTGASGRLGYALCRHLTATGENVVGVRHGTPLNQPGVREIASDLGEPEAAQRLIGEIRPDIVVHAMALADVDSCEADPAAARRLNVDATRAVAAAARRAGARLVHISTDQLWAGDRQMIAEDVPPAPINVYGRTKSQAERAALEEAPDAVVLRTNFFGAGRHGRGTLSDWVRDGLRAGRPLNMFTDVFYTPIELGLLCEIIVEMARAGAGGVFHACGSERLSKYDFGMRLAARLGYANPAIRPASVDSAGLVAPRPREMSLATGKIARVLGRDMPDLDASLARLLRDVA